MNVATIQDLLEAAYDADCADSADAQYLHDNFPRLVGVIVDILDA